MAKIGAGNFHAQLYIISYSNFKQLHIHLNAYALFYYQYLTLHLTNYLNNPIVKISY
jgi:hypothetical protein